MWLTRVRGAGPSRVYRLVDYRLDSTTPIVAVVPQAPIGQISQNAMALRIVQHGPRGNLVQRAPTAHA